MKQHTVLLIAQVLIMWGAIAFAVNAVDSNLAFCMIWIGFYLELGAWNRHAQ